jgi:hypothetical protein
MRAIASPIPLEAPVTIAARSGMAGPFAQGGRRAATYSGFAMRTPFVVMAVLGAALYGLWALTSTPEPAPSSPPPPRAPISVIAQRVERIRGLKFDRLPEPVEVTPRQARDEGLADLDRTYPGERRRADEEVLKLLGLIDPDVSLRSVSATTFSQGVAGYYDPRTKRLRIVRGAATGTRVITEMVLAHELDHALEDQRFGLADAGGGGSDDGSLARLALVEGSATALMYRYVQRTFSSEETLGGLLGAAFADTGSFPPFLAAQLVWPYTGGQRFVEYLLRRAGGRWDLVNLADRVKPPVSTEQVLHPEKYLRSEPPRPVRLRVGAILGPRYERTVAGRSGELQTREILAGAGGGGSGEAAAGWGGDRYELWERRDRGGCLAPCRSQSVLMLRWAWDTRRDEREFAVKLRQFADGLKSPGVAVAERRGEVTLALAPEPRLARRLASSPGG